jgi:hypothetical protein
MSTMKTRIQGLSLLDRALAAITDDELTALIDTLPDDHRTALDSICGARDGGFDDPAARVVALRATAARGRLSGPMEQLATVLVDPCLAECIEALGEHSDNPSEEQFLDVAPTLVEHHGVPVVRLMMAATVAGEANASVMLTRLLKKDETLALPPLERNDEVVVLTKEADPDLKAKRKAKREAEQAAARARREQQAKARHKH